MRKGQVYLSCPYAFVNVYFHLLWHARKLRILYQANFLYRNKKGFLQVCRCMLGHSVLIFLNTYFLSWWKLWNKNSFFACCHNSLYHPFLNIPNPIFWEREETVLCYYITVLGILTYIHIYTAYIYKYYVLNRYIMNIQYTYYVGRYDYISASTLKKLLKQ